MEVAPPLLYLYAPLMKLTGQLLVLEDGHLEVLPWAVFFPPSLFCPIGAVEPINKTALIQLSEKSAIDEVLGFDVCNPGIPSFHEPLYVAQPFEGRIRLPVDKSEDVLVTLFEHSRVGNPKPVCQGIQDGRFTPGAKYKSQALYLCL